MISVLFPVKNGGDDRRRCLERIHAQKVDYEVELIVAYARGEFGWLPRIGKTCRFPYTLVHAAVRFTVLQLGVRRKRLAASIPPRLSALGNYWSTTR